MDDRRQQARLDLRNPLSGQLMAKYAVSVLDVSVAGVRIAHEVMLQPRQPCYLHVTLTDRPLLLSTQVVWSSAKRFTTDGHPVLYHSGMKFDRLSEASHKELAAFLARHQRE